MTVDWTNEVALVTGAGSGIGRALAIGLLSNGACVVGVGRRLDALQETGRRAEGGWTRPDALQEPVGSGDRYLALAGDVSVEADVDRILGQAVRRFEGVSILVNNAGIAEYAPIARMTVEVFDRTLAVNLRGPFLLTRAVLPEMLRRGRGHVLMVGSVAGMKAFAGCGAYGASKFGLSGFTQVLREETRGTGVRVTLLVPGATDTPIWGDEGPDPKRLMPAEAVADAAIWALGSVPGLVPEEIVLRPPGGDL
jgi:NAD(P)-dependent dehydrogenase (short-subunit alcohol dehydrogenase family)